MTTPATSPAGPTRAPGADQAPSPLPEPLPAPLPAAVPVRAPVRVQRRRTAGWRMPAGAVYVGRPTRWGNPVRHDGTAGGRAAAVAAHAELAAADPALQAAVRERLGGRDLACWCPAGQPCHADTLLAIANPTRDETRGAGPAGWSA